MEIVGIQERREFCPNTFHFRFSKCKLLTDTETCGLFVKFEDPIRLSIYLLVPGLGKGIPNPMSGSLFKGR